MNDEYLRSLSDTDLQDMYWTLNVETEDGIVLFRRVEAELRTRSIGIMRLGDYPSQDRGAAR